jgi:hypothetical protein
MTPVYLISIRHRAAERDPVAVASSEERAREIAEEQVLEAERSLDGWYWGSEEDNRRTLASGNPESPVLEVWPFEVEGARQKGTVLRFTDGINIDTGGPLRTLVLPDGWYVVGRGMLLPCADKEEADEMLVEMRARREIS